jgi:hypothetical protein
MGLKDILKQHNIPIPNDFDERLDVIISGLKKKPDFHDKLRKFKQKRGGAEPEAVAPPIVPDSEDYLGPRLRWFLKAVTSPYARTMLEGIFLVVFFLSYLERIPIFGSILSAALDVILAGGKIMVKSVQSILPAAIGVIPLPYMSMVGISMAALFGFTVWPIFAIVSLSRQDFMAATESYIRMIPPPIGDMLANTFLEGNRAVAKIDEKRIKLGNDISNGLNQISQLATTVSSTMKDGFASLAEQTRAAASAMPAMPAMPTAPGMPKMPAMPAMPAMPTAPKMPAMPVAPVSTGGFHRRTRRKAWRTRRTRTRSATR